MYFPVVCTSRLSWRMFSTNKWVLLFPVRTQLYLKCSGSVGKCYLLLVSKISIYSVPLIVWNVSLLFLVLKAAVQDRLNEQEGVPSVFNPPPSRPLQVNTADHRIYSYVVSRPQPRASYLTVDFCLVSLFALWTRRHTNREGNCFLSKLLSPLWVFFPLKTKCRATPSASVISVAIFCCVIHNETAFLMS